MKLLSVPEKIPKMNVDEGGEEDNMMVDPDPNGLYFVGAYIADLNTDDEVWMAAVSDPSEHNTQVAVVVKKYEQRRAGV